MAVPVATLTSIADQVAAMNSVARVWVGQASGEDQHPPDTHKAVTLVIITKAMPRRELAEQVDTLADTEDQMVVQESL